MINFILGILSVLALVVIGVLIFGMVKLFKLSSSLESMGRTHYTDFDHLHRRIEDERKEIELKITELYSYTDRRIDKSLSNLKN